MYRRVCRSWGGGAFCAENTKGLPAEVLTNCFAENGTQYANGTCYLQQVRWIAAGTLQEQYGALRWLRVDFASSSAWLPAHCAASRLHHQGCCCIAPCATRLQLALVCRWFPHVMATAMCHCRTARLSTSDLVSLCSQLLSWSSSLARLHCATSRCASAHQSILFSVLARMSRYS